MNHLDFRTTNDNDLSIELLVDGRPIEGLADGGDTSIPHWLFEGLDLPNYLSVDRGGNIYLLGVCSCGEHGCGAAGCFVEKDAETVTFYEIFIDGFCFPPEFQFQFTRENYDSVMKRISDEIATFSSSLVANK